jgi:hypothetical protein
MKLKKDRKNKKIKIKIKIKNKNEKGGWDTQKEEDLAGGVVVWSLLHDLCFELLRVLVESLVRKASTDLGEESTNGEKN